VSIKEQSTGRVAQSGREIRFLRYPDRLDEGELRFCKGLTVGEVFVTMELDNINESVGQELPGEGGIGVDEDPYPEDAVCEGGQERGGGLGRAVALALVPEVDSESVDPELSEALRVTGGGDAADLESWRGGRQEAVEKCRHRCD